MSAVTLDRPARERRPALDDWLARAEVLVAECERAELERAAARVEEFEKVLASSVVAC